jgi:stage II sporulation protein AA (anti-sigma F factor antagonist)
MADELVPVRILGLPVPLYRKAAEHQDALRRELSLLRYSDTEPPAQLFALSDELHERFSGFGERPQQAIQDALDANLDTVDLDYDIPADAADASRRLGQILDEVDAFCAAGEHLVTLTTPPDALAFRRWFLGEFIDQISGAAPVAWHDRPSAPDVTATAPRPPGRATAEVRDIHVRDDLDIATAPALRDTLADLLHSGVTDVRLDLREVTFVDSVGMSVIVAAHQRCREQGGSLVLRVNPKLARTLQVMGLDDVLDVQL